MKFFIKITIYAVMAVALLIAGYAAGLLVQHKRDVRYEAAVNLACAMKLHKAVTTGAYNYVLRDANCRLMNGVMNLDSGLDVQALSGLFEESFSARNETAGYRCALARIIGMHRARPDIVFPVEMQPELDTFVPRTKYEQRALDLYASWDPAGR